MIDYTKRPSGGDGVRLSKVTLTKSAPSVSLDKTSGASGQMRVNLNWTQAAPQSGGFLKRLAAPRGIDLDLGALWETVDGSKGVVQALGNSFGRLDGPPYVRLDGDDRSGAVTGGENLHVNLDALAQIKRVLIFAYIYEGVPNWASADGVVTMYPHGAAPIEVRLDEATTGRSFCAVALLTNVGGRLEVRREVQYVSGGQAALDQAYGWGLRWTRGSK
jgi:tellurite resistance protein TerA